MTRKSDDFSRHYCDSLCECFYFDTTNINPLPEGFLRKLIAIFLSANYSMPVLMRISQYLHRRQHTTLSAIIRRLNQIMNNFGHGADPKIYSGVSFHHTNVVITTNAVVESDVHIYSGVVLGMKDGSAPHIKKGAKLCSNSVVIGNVTVGDNAIVAPGAVVVRDVQNGTVVGGIPAKKIGLVNSNNCIF